MPLELPPDEPQQPRPRLQMALVTGVAVVAVLVVLVLFVASIWRLGPSLSEGITLPPTAESPRPAVAEQPEQDSPTPVPSLIASATPPGSALPPTGTSAAPTATATSMAPPAATSSPPTPAAAETAGAATATTQPGTSATLQELNVTSTALAGRATVIAQDLTQTAAAAQAQDATAVAQGTAITVGDGPRVALHLSDSLGNAAARYAPDIEGLLLQNGYEANIMQFGNRRGLRASQVNYAQSTWIRDLDYAISGYSYALGNMTVLRENLGLFLERVDASGLVLESITVREGQLEYASSRNWDSMPNLIHAAYIYVAKTGDLSFYMQHRATLQRVGQWIAALDTDSDGLPDTDTYPFGYYDEVYNGVMHTYAIARFYAAYHELAQLERFAGFDGEAAQWDQWAALLREGFHRPVAPVGRGYWLPDQAWPVAWHRADGSTVDVLETFGVFEALRSGLIGSPDGQRYQVLAETLHTLLPDLMADPVPMKLALGGYESDLRRQADPPVPLWMMDASAPWIVGIAAPAYGAAGYPQDAETLMQSYMTMARNTTPPVVELMAGTSARYGPGDTGDGGRAWDSAAWFMAVYGGHYGVTMTPAALVVQPRPFATLENDGISNLSYQGALVQLGLDATSRTYTLQADRPIVARLLPMGNAAMLRVNGGPAQADELLVLQPGQLYTVVSE